MHAAIPTTTTLFSRAARLIALLLRQSSARPSAPKRRVAGLSFDDIVDASSRATTKNRLRLQRRTKAL